MELPEELMTLILSKLPVKSVLRFKCVQKSWYSLINSPQFIRLHLSSINKNDYFLVSRFVEQQQQNFLSLHSYETLEDLGNEVNIPILNGFGAAFCGSCDGLICFSNYKDQIVICNPTIREFRPLFVPLKFGERSDFQIVSVAFGSEPNTGKYTVVMIGVPDYTFFNEGIHNDLEARLYDLSTDSWRKTVAAIPPGPFDYFHRAISLNGAIHWCPNVGSNSNNILTFHISNEVTEFIPMPDFAKVTHVKELCVTTKSQISLIIYDDSSGWLESWVMTEYGVKESWARIFKIGSPPLNVNRPTFAFWDEQRLLLICGQREKKVSILRPSAPPRPSSTSDQWMV